MKLKDLVEQYGEYDVEEWFEIGTDGVADEKGIKLKKPSPKTVWDLQEGDEYFLITPYGTAVRRRAVGKSDNEYVENGNVCLTEEEATHEIERRKVETLLLKHGGRRWFIKGKSNMFVHYDARNKKLRYDLKTSFSTQGAIYFDDPNKLDKAVKAIGEDRIIKALFEVR